MYRNSEHIKIVEHWRDVWWNRETDAEFLGSPTGTVTAHLELRRVQDIHGKIVHIPDDGELENVDGECDAYQVRLRCKTCGTTFCAEI